MNKVQLLASFPSQEGRVDKRGHNHYYDIVRHVRFRTTPARIECSCGCVLAYSPNEHDVSSLAVLARICPHIEALYRGDVRNATVTERGRELFAWCWAQLALEQSR